MAAIPGTLYRRLAEVIDGYRTGRTAWFALALEPPHDPLTTSGGETAFESEQAANAAIAAAAGSGEAYQAFGPCKTVRELSRSNITQVTIRDQEGREVTRRLKPDADLILWSMSAFDKFVMPYYFGVLGRSEEAHAKLMEIRRSVKESGIWGHQWPTRGFTLLEDLRGQDLFEVG